MLTGASEYFDQQQQTENELALQILRHISECPSRDARPIPSGASKGRTRRGGLQPNRRRPAKASPAQRL